LTVQGYGVSGCMIFVISWQPSYFKRVWRWRLFRNDLIINVNQQRLITMHTQYPQVISMPLT
jgi:hypothetical protein